MQTPLFSEIVVAGQTVAASRALSALSLVRISVAGSSFPAEKVQDGELLSMLIVKHVLKSELILKRILKLALKMVLKVVKKVLKLILNRC